MAFYHYIVLFLIVFSFTAESAELWYQYCNDNSIIKSPQLSSNVDFLLSRLISGTVTKGYITTSYGKSKNQVYGLAQCRADVDQTTCSSCIHDAAKQIRQLCPNQAGASVWYDVCFLRYDKTKFSGKLDTSTGIYFYNVENVTDPYSFNTNLGTLTGQIISQAVKHGSKGFGRGQIPLSTSDNIYGLVQCTRDLSPANCNQCLNTAAANLPNFCEDKKGCRVLYNSCILRYELYAFF